MELDRQPESTKKQYSEQFVQQLEAKKYQIEDQENKPFFIKNKLFLFGLVAIVIAISFMIASFVINNQKSKQLNDLANLYFSVQKSKNASDKYQNLIDDVGMRAHNSNFYLTLSALEVTIDDYRQSLDKKKNRQVDAIIETGDQSVKDVMEKLERAYLNETLDRVYLNQMLILINQIKTNINQIKKTNKDQQFVQQLEQHYQSLDKIRQSAENTVLED